MHSNTSTITRSLLFAIGAAVAVGCSSDDKGVSTSLPAITIATTIAPTTTTEPAPTTSASASADGQIVADCVEYIPIGAFTGDQKATDLWNFVHQDVSTLPILCTALLESEPATVDALVRDLAAYRLAISSTTAAVTTGAPPGSTSTTLAP